MAQVIEQVSIPSSRGNKVYDIVAYDDGGVICTCPYGSRNGVQRPTGKSCKHVREYREQAKQGPVPDTLTAVPSYTPDNPIRKEVVLYHIYYKDECMAYVRLERVYIDEADDILRREWSWQLLDGETTGAIFSSSDDAAAAAVQSFLEK